MEYDVKRHGIFMKWHSVENALPDKDQNVLVYRVGHIGDLMSVYTYMGNNEWENGYGYWTRTEDEGITHWMPLPKAPLKPCDKIKR